MKILFVDLETSSYDPKTAQILTGSFSICDYKSLDQVDEFELNFQPIVPDKMRYPDRHKFFMEQYSAAQEIHGIDIQTALRFNKPEISFKRLTHKLRSGEFIFCCHAKFTNNYFDAAFIQMLYATYCGDLLNTWRKTFKGIESTHTYAKYLNDLGLINPTGLSLDKLASYYNIELDHHNCRSDRVALQRIYSRLRDESISRNDQYSYDKDYELRTGIKKRLSNKKKTRSNHSVDMFEQRNSY